ncbi:hypothetical protein WR25_00770 [Diploscapter pachys]|uniref:Uncharacterized protein n=1 Tax=Diploscapter pachys TaxID=2018661 RepID=A0A2A2KHP7_9BILA|nr:hypothetical protein WR25_00770 [Diploscapter pachys]
MTIVPVILSGGSGTRLWPMSRPEMPKQLLPLTADETMLQLTARRAHGEAFAAPIVVANARHADAIDEQLAAADAKPQAVILEPVGRNTAPAIALAALAAGAEDALLVMPSDHVIADVEAFRAAVDAAMPMVADGWLVTFGIAPDAPETGYGWIQTAMRQARREGVRVYPDAEAFGGSPSDSIDYAVMERADRVAVVPVAMGWSDVGSWDALLAISPCDERGNHHRGEVLAIDTNNCLIRSDGVRISAVGVSDLIVVACGNDVMIVPRGRSQDVKKLIEAMQK